MLVFWAEISVQSQAFLGPNSRPRVQQFQNAHNASNIILACRKEIYCVDDYCLVFYFSPHTVSTLDQH